MKPNDGGPAFPRQHAIADANDDNFKLGHSGMSLRDWFAGQALIGIMRRDGSMANRFHPTDDAAWTYQIADAMLAQRDKETDNV